MLTGMFTSNARGVSMTTISPVGGALGGSPLPQTPVHQARLMPWGESRLGALRHSLVPRNRGLVPMAWGSGLHWHHDWLRHQAPLQEKQVKKLCKEFCRATVEARFGTDEKKVLQVLERVNRQGLKWAFERAVLQQTAASGKRFDSVEAVIESEFAGNPFERKFKNASRQEALDYWRWGHNHYRGSGWDYRLYGMYRSLADFMAVCKQHPAMSAGLIGAVAYLGSKYPFLGGLSGLGIMGWGTAALVGSEVRAAQHPPRMNAAKAEQYTASGENLAAVLITALGFHGIKDGALLGKAAIQSVQAPAGQKRHPFQRLGQKAVAAVTATEQKYPGVVPHDHTGAAKWVKTTLFVSGLLDNVLLPFNWLAEKLGAASSGAEKTAH